MKDSKLYSHLWSIKINGCLANYDMETGQEIAPFDRQVMASHLVNHNLATIDGNKWRLTQLGRQALETGNDLDDIGDDKDRDSPWE